MVLPPFPGILVNVVLLATTNEVAPPRAMEALPATIHEALQAMQKGTLTPTDLVEHCLARIHQADDAHSAFVLVDEQGARQQAVRLSANLVELRRNNKLLLENLSPLYGIPIAVKDIINVKNMPTRAGSPLRYNALPCDQDAPIVAALRQAGAIILGKTVTTEWAHLDPVPGLCNPWNGRQTPGGSSSGSAVAVAMGMCMAALGTQTGGSILRPASYCGICGLKPTFAPLAMQGIAPVSFHLDHVGPMARNVADLQVMYDVMMMGSSNESSSPRVLEQPPVLSRLDEYFVQSADAAVQEVFEKALAKLEGVQWRKASRLPESFSELHRSHYVIMAVDAAQVHAKSFHESPQHFAPRITELVQDGLRTELHDYVVALRHQQLFRCEISQCIKDAPLWIMCSTPTTAPGPQTTGDARFNSPWSYCGLPTVTIPCSLDHKGLPVGVQIVAPHHREHELLASARWCQERLGSMPYDNLGR